MLTKIIPEKSVEYFFKGKLEKVLSEQGVNASEDAISYISTTMTNSLKTDEFYKRNSDHLDKKPLAFVLSDAIKSDYPQKYEKLRTIGDFSLIMSGFFEDNLKKLRRANLVNYYVQIGSISYEALSEMFIKRYLNELFGELSEKFIEFKDALKIISLRTQLNDKNRVFDLFSKYISTRDELLGRELKRAGFSLKMQ